MDISVSLGLYDSFGTPRDRRVVQTSSRPPAAGESSPVPVPVPSSFAKQAGGTRLVAETREGLPEGGYRRILTFEQDDGRTLTKIEQFTVTERGARREVFQQNPSGSVTRYEEILDREPGGTFRKTQRFQDETGDISTVITPGTRVLDPFILTGGNGTLSFSAPSPFDPLRGTRLDLRA